IITLVATAGTACILVLVVMFFTSSTGRILLGNLALPGEYDDEQAFLRDEEEALEEMDDISRSNYLQARSFQEANPPDSVQTDISLSQHMAIQEKGVSAWQFEPDFENGATCMVEAHTEVIFSDADCSVQTNLPIPRQNEIYYWEAKLYEKPSTSVVSIGLATKPYPPFRLPGYHRYSVAYDSLGNKRLNQPFKPTRKYGPPLVEGDVVGVGYSPRSNTVFFTKNGQKLDEAAHNMRQNLFPTIGANGPCVVHVNFGHAGFVYIAANVNKWGLAPAHGNLAPPPPYGVEHGSILLERGSEASSQQYRSLPGPSARPRLSS
ncbi:hypothetical protein CANCADRAFT_11440, partial [Tortispora caseinolytica NRRL Y-17796]